MQQMCTVLQQNGPNHLDSAFASPAGARGVRGLRPAQVQRALGRSGGGEAAVRERESAESRMVIVTAAAQETAVPPSPRAFVFALENSVWKDSYRLPMLLPHHSSVRILTDSVLQ